jgi:hypothetical protein
VDDAEVDVFAFAGARCDRIVAAAKHLQGSLKK